MIYSLVPYVGTGQSGDAFRPRGHDQPFWRAIDLRPDCTRPDGYALLVTRERVRESGAIDLGPSPDDRWSMRSLASRLGVTLVRSNLRSAVAALLIQHSREDGTRWRPLWPEGRRYRIWLGGLLWEMPAIAGGIVATETWTHADNAALTADHTWSEIVGTGWAIVSNEAKITGNVSVCVAFCLTPATTADHKVTATFVEKIRAANAVGVGVLCRKDNSATRTFYEYEAVHIATGNINFHVVQKSVADAFTTLGTDLADHVDGDVIQVEANGSSITGRRNGAGSVGPITDTAIAGNVHGGIRGVSDFASNSARLDNWSIEDLAPPVFRSIRIGGAA